MIKKCIYIVFLLMFSSTLYASGPFGLGIAIGDTTGVSAKYNLSKKNFFDATIGWSGSNVRADANYNFLIHKKLRLQKAHYLRPYFGIGGKIQEKTTDDEDKTYFGVRVPAGLLYRIPGVPVEVTGAFVLNFFLVPETDADLGLSLTLRYFF